MALQSPQASLQAPPVDPATQAARSQTRHAKTAPGPRYYTPFGFFSDFRRNPLQFYTDAAKYGDVVRFRMGPWSTHVVYHPDHIKYIVQDNNHNYGRSPVVTLLKPLVGDGLLVSDGEVWRRQRRLAQPTFHRKRIAGFATTMTEAALAVLDRWRTTDQHEREILTDMSSLTLDVTCRALFSTDASTNSESVQEAMQGLLEHFNYRIERFFTLPERFPTRRNRRFWKKAKTIDTIAYDIIAERRRTGEDKGDLVSMLMQARDEETGEGMSDKQLRDEVVTFLGAGTETTAVLLAWAWYLLSQYPEVEHKLRAELADVLNGRPPTMEDLPLLTYTRMVVEETLRLYPPAWANSRTVLEDDEIGGYHIPAKTMIAFIPYVTHRDSSFWDQPDVFDPERFLPERSDGRPRYAYCPFSGGPRQCIGNEFALMEAQLVLATIAQQYRLQLVPGHPVEPHPIFTLRPRYGLKMTLHEV